MKIVDSSNMNNNVAVTWPTEDVEKCTYWD